MLPSQRTSTGIWRHRFQGEWLILHTHSILSASEVANKEWTLVATVVVLVMRTYVRWDHKISYAWLTEQPSHISGNCLHSHCITPILKIELNKKLGRWIYIQSIASDTTLLKLPPHPLVPWKCTLSKWMSNENTVKPKLLLDEEYSLHILHFPLNHWHA